MNRARAESLTHSERSKPCALGVEPTVSARAVRKMCARLQNDGDLQRSNICRAYHRKNSFSVFSCYSAIPSLDYFCKAGADVCGTWSCVTLRSGSEEFRFPLAVAQKF
eukprot:5051070-Amphidinium_carterae.1